jgi:hypothetical protein
VEVIVEILMVNRRTLRMRKKIDYKHLIEDVCGFTCENDNYSKPLPSLKAQEALNELCDYFLGEDWYEPTGQVHPEIVNFAIVEEIEKRYRGAKIKRSRRAENGNTCRNC